MKLKIIGLWVLAGLIWMTDVAVAGRIVIQRLSEPDPPPACNQDNSCPNGVAEF